MGLQTACKDLEWSSQESLTELGELAKTAGLTVTQSISQKRETPHPTFYVGKGKLSELGDVIKEHSIEVLVTDDELSANQQKRLEETLSIKILDRTALILDIFALRAQTREAQLQVEMAQLEYLRPRLTRLWTHLSRLGGGIGTRGPGEKQLEVDKRRLNQRLSHIKRKLTHIESQRQLTRHHRDSIPVMNGAIVGYTNAGKSTLLNQLTQADVLAEDRLFATLDPTTRHLELPSQERVLLTDTVGFIQKLPHQLVSSFRATLEEITQSQFILHVIDASHPNLMGMIHTSNLILEDLNAESIPRLYVFNKADQVKDLRRLKGSTTLPHPHLFISAFRQSDLTLLQHAIVELLKPFHECLSFRIPYSRMDVLALLHDHGHILEEAYEQEGIRIRVDIHQVVGHKIMAMLGKDSS